MKAVMAQLEAGVSDVFQSGQYKNYLGTMSKFHHYSFNNILLIAMQFPAASQVAGFNDWKKKFGRQVKKGERGIKILAPCAYGATLVSELIDPDTDEPVLDSKGKPIVRRTPINARRFKVVTVFDVSQTEGKELPQIAAELTGGVERYAELSAALAKLSPYPIQFGDLPGTAKGCCDYAEQQITVRPGMSEAQTLKTLIHEIAHAKLHSQRQEGDILTPPSPEIRRTREVEAESVAYVVSQHFGLDTSEYSFGYIAAWSHGKELPELRTSLSVIQAASAELIDSIEGRGLERSKIPPRRHTPKRKPTQPIR